MFLFALGEAACTSGGSDNTQGDLGGGQGNDLSSSGMKILFVTNAAFTGNLGGLTGADQKCGAAAGALDIAGSFKAWLSDSTTDALDRIADVGPWYITDGSAIAFMDKANLTTQPRHTLDMNEKGQLLKTTERVWTGTLVGGKKKAGQSCNNWTNDTYNAHGWLGIPDHSDETWTDAFYGNTAISDGDPCQIMRHLYCIQQ